MESTLNKYQEYEEKKALLVAFLQKQEQLQSSKISLYKKTSNLFRAPFQKEKSFNKIDVTKFNQVLSIDAENLVANVEGMITYEALVKATLPYGLLPTIVPELKTITVGGAAAGLGIESSSFRYGLVHESIIEMEILLSDGKTLVCQADNEYRDLFYAFPNTYGTLGYALRLKIKLISAKKYIRLSHHYYSSSAHYFEALGSFCQENRFSNTPIAYIDGTIFSQTEMYITCAEFVDEVPSLSNYCYMDIYYRSIQKKREDFLTTEDYIWRWDADWFWCSDRFGMQNQFLRALLGKWMLSSAVYSKIMRFFQRHPHLEALAKNKNEESIIQDVLIPLTEASTFFNFLHENIPIRPIWICPTYSVAKKDTTENSYDFCPLKGDTLYVDFGFWGRVPTNRPLGYYNRKIEKEAFILSGLKSLYSSSYYTLEEFWKIYNEPRYRMLKAKYDPEGRLSSFYAKIIGKRFP